VSRRPLEPPDEAAARLAAERLSDEERAQLWQRLGASRVAALAARRRRMRAVVIALPAIAAALYLGLSLRAREPGASPRATSDRCAPDAARPLLQLGAHCAARALAIDGDEWALQPGAQVRQVPDGAQMIAGLVRFHVRPRKAGRAPFRVRVSHGEVRVVGTAFEIEQHSASGSIAVSEGVIEFVWADGTRERVAAGQQLRWPRRAAAATAVAAPEPAPPEASASPPEARGAGAPEISLDDALERLLQLRSQRRFGEAVVLLRRTLAAHGLSPVQRERISYELGLALEADDQPACPHWRAHVKRFGAGSHATTLAQRLERCTEE
jgi:FecR protein